MENEAYEREWRGISDGTDGRNSGRSGNSTIPATSIGNVFPRTQVAEHAMSHGEADSRPTSKIRQRVNGIRANRATPNGNGNASVTIQKMAAMRRRL